MGIWRPTGDSQWSDRHDVYKVPHADRSTGYPPLVSKCPFLVYSSSTTGKLAPTEVGTSVGASFPVVDEEYTRNGHLETNGG
jgi:hypothetical protein